MEAGTERRLAAGAAGWQAAEPDRGVQAPGADEGAIEPGAGYYEQIQ